MHYRTKLLQLSPYKIVADCLVRKIIAKYKYAYKLQPLTLFTSYFKLVDFSQLFKSKSLKLNSFDPVPSLSLSKDCSKESLSTALHLLFCCAGTTLLCAKFSLFRRAACNKNSKILVALSNSVYYKYDSFVR